MLTPPDVYTCQFFASTCTVYSPAGKVLRTLTSADGINNPQGIHVAANGNWYVADTGANEVLILAPGGTSTVGSLGTYYPVDVATSGNVVAVSVGGQSPGVTVFVNSKQSSSLTDTRTLTPGGVAFDSHGNCYWAFNDATGAGRVDKFTACAGQPVDLGFDLNYVAGIAFDSSDNLLVNDVFMGTYVCKGTSNCVLTFTGFLQPLMLNFARGATDLVEDDGVGAVTVRRYPSGKVGLTIQTGTQTSGAALSTSNAH